MSFWDSRLAFELVVRNSLISKFQGDRVSSVTTRRITVRFAPLRSDNRVRMRIFFHIGFCGLDGGIEGRVIERRVTVHVILHLLLGSNSIEFTSASVDAITG